MGWAAARRAGLLAGGLLTGGLVATGLPSAAQATQCSPVDGTARVLRSPNPNDTHPDWRGESRLGTSWTFERAGTAPAGFLRGNLVSPRGGVVNRGVYILPREWECDGGE